MSVLGNSVTQQAFTPAVDVYSGNGSTVAFTLSRPVASVAQVQAFIENVPQSPVDAFTVNGNVITFTSAPPSGSSNIYVRYTSPITQVIAPSDGTVGTSALAAGAVTATKVASGQVFALNGVAFPATQVPSADANTLDDYEEGSWTPVIGGTSGASGQVYATQSGNYTKIGCLVNLTGYVHLTTKGTFSGSYVCITGLPFTSSGADWQISVGYYGALAASKVYVGGYTSGSVIVMTGKSAASTELTVGGLAQSDIQNGSLVAFTVTYKATA